ncbi:MAG: hypothetical protein LKE27_01075 [Atopobiaceae bacterium]|nr:hypothetical protein [Atopobiaceae bacterium]
MIQMLALPRPGFSADMYLSGSDSFVRPEEDAMAFAIEQAWHRLCHQVPHIFEKHSMCMRKSIEEGKLSGPIEMHESLPMLSSWVRSELSTSVPSADMTWGCILLIACFS